MVTGARTNDTIATVPIYVEREPLRKSNCPHPDIDGASLTVAVADGYNVSFPRDAGGKQIITLAHGQEPRPGGLTRPRFATEPSGPALLEWTGTAVRRVVNATRMRRTAPGRTDWIKSGMT